MNSSDSQTIGVVIPTYRRLPYLRACLESLYQQSRTPDKIWVMCQQDDKASVHFLKESYFPGCEVVIVPSHGLLPALRQALATADTDLICFLQDNVAVQENWVSRLEAMFEKDPELGGVGGRAVWIRHGEVLPCKSAQLVGVMTALGDLIGNHHCHTVQETPWEVDFLKGYNMAFRRHLLPKTVDPRINGFHSHFEVDFCFHVKAQGYKILYDPRLIVDYSLDAPSYEIPISDRWGLIREPVTAFAYNRLLMLAKYTTGLQRVWVLLTHLFWILPLYSVSQTGWLGTMLNFRRIFQAALTGWFAGSKPLPENLLTLTQPEPEPVMQSSSG